MILTVFSTTVEKWVVGPAMLRRAMLGVVVACALLVVPVSGASATPCTPAGADPAPANAPLPGSCFEAYDGDQADSDAAAGPRLDWAGVKDTAGFSTGLDFTVGSKDSQFGPGGSELAPDGWTFDLGTLGSDKYNVFSAWNYREPVPTSDLYLGLSFTRESNNGATYLAFELNQKLPGYRTATETTSNRTIKVPTRSSGDLLITYDVDNNDLTPRIGVCVWSGDEHSGTWTDGNGTDVGASCPEVTPSVVQAAMNTAAITAPDNALSGVPLQTGQFGEAAINLPAALRALAHSTLPTNPCVSFGYAWIHSRSSPSITSNQQDYILPSDPISVANCSVTGRKINDLDGSGTAGAGEGGLGGFTFYADYDNDGVKDAGEPFDVSAPRDVNDLRPAGTYTITGLNPGTYPIREVGQAGWTCTAPSPCNYPITMAGQAVSGKDFLNFQPRSISGTKYEDLNADGSRQQGEGGLAGFTFYVDSNGDGYDASDPQAVSAADGSWTITGLAPGDYTVRERAKAGWTCSDPGSPCAKSVTVAAGTDSTGVLFGNYRTASVSGTKYEDLNADGSRQQGEGGLAGFTFYVDSNGDGYDASDPQAVSAADGSWTISGLKPGSHTVIEKPKAGWTCSDPGDPCQKAVSLTSGQASTGMLFGNWQPASISGGKYEDGNANGSKDPGEGPLSGFTFYIDQGTAGYQDSDPHATSAADGTWTITGLTPGTYTVIEKPRSGWTCSDPGGSCGRSLTVTSGQSGSVAPFGNWQAGSISGSKYEDLNADGTKDPGEGPLAGWTFYVDQGASGYQDSDPHATSGADGTWTITGLTPGSYTVKELAQAGWTCSAPGSPCQRDATVTSGTETSIAAFGNWHAGSISGSKYEDLNADGTKNPGEGPLSGFTFYVDSNGDGYDASDPQAVSAADGSWTISGLKPGSYTVIEKPKAGWTCSDPGDPCRRDATVTSSTDTTIAPFGNWRAASVGGVKYHDLNADGSRQQGEGGLAGFTFYVDQGTAGYQDSDPHATSAADGSWTITGLTPGAYTVKELAKAGWTCSDPGNPCERPLTLTSGETGTVAAFGNYTDQAISGSKYEDVNANGSKDPGEGPLGGFTFYVDQGDSGYQDSDPHATSAADGTWSITGLKPGSYTVKERAKDGWTCSDPGDPCRRDATVVSGSDTAVGAFGNWRSGSISGTKYEDLNADGTKDPGEGPLSGFTFYVDSNGDGYDASDPQAVSAADGTWTITGLTPGTHIVRELAKAGWTCSDPGDPCRREATVTSGTDTTIAAFGNYRDATISGRKFADLDQDHEHGPNEPYLAGWTIYVDRNGNGALDEGEPSDVTDDGGAYSIGGLKPSDAGVQLREVQKAGWTCTAPATTDDHGCLFTLTLHSGDQKTADFGNFRSIGVSLDKTGPDLAHHGDTLNYAIEVTTQSEAPLTVVDVTDPKCAAAPVLTGKSGGNQDALLEKGETWTYECSLALPVAHTASDSPFVNTAFVSAQDELGREVKSQDDHPTRILHPAIDLDKQVRLGTAGAYTDGPLEAYVGDLLGYRVTVTNTGDTALTPAWGTDAASSAFVDARCDAGTISGPAGDDGDGKLGVGEAWTYTCTHRITAGGPDPLTNTVTVTGTDVLGGPKGTVTDTDSTTTDVVHPAIAIDKTGPANATAGALIAYTLDVTNPGDMSFADPLVVLTDDLCQAPPALQSRNGDGSPGTLDPGDRWTYTCQVQTQSGQTEVHNVAGVTGTDHNGRQVSATDDATTVLAQQAVSPVTVVSPGAAKLRGPVGCPTTRLVKASVTGSRIVRVTWYVDGRKVATQTKPDKHGRWIRSLRLRSLRYGVHTVRAQVQFATDSNTKTKTLRLSFTRCRPAVVRPKFTG